MPKQQPQYGGFQQDTGTPANPNFRLWPVLFNDAANEGDARSGAKLNNISLRPLDQAWRVAKPDFGEQAILLLRVATKEGPAEETTVSASSPSRLWLGKLPTSGEARPPVSGTLKQETYIRVFIPVKFSKK